MSRDKDPTQEAGKAFDKMVEAWHDSQTEILSAQTKIADDFARIFAPDSGGMYSKTAGAEAWKALMKTWTPAWGSATAMSAPTASDENNLAAMFSVFDPITWVSYAPEQFRATLETIAGGPRFADLITPHADAAEAIRDGLDFQKAATDFSAVIHEAWVRAFKRYGEEHSLEELQSGKTQESLDSWLKIVNDELLATQRSSEFMDAQRRLLLAILHLKRRQAEQAEAWCSAYQMPTRSEMDDLTQIVHRLRTELRSVKRELALIMAGTES